MVFSKRHWKKAQESKTAIINNLVKDNQLDQVTLDNLEGVVYWMIINFPISV